MQIGQWVSDNFEIMKIVQGGMGTIYICYSRAEKKKVVLKTFQDRFFEDNTVVHRFIEEASNWVSLDKHPNIVRAFSVFHIHFRPYILLEYLEPDRESRLSLSDYLRPGRPLPEETIVDLSLQVCRGLRHAQQKIKGFVHADIKPSNIFLSNGTTLKIGDFGLSRSAAGATNHHWGTPAYMSPEHFTRNPLDIRSDLYSFGCILYEMAAGKRPFQQTNNGGRDLHRIYRHLHFQHQPAAPFTAQSNTQTTLNRVILRCLEKDPAKRFKNFSELESALLHISDRTAIRVASNTPQLEVMTDEDLINKAVSLLGLGQTDAACHCFGNCQPNGLSRRTTWASCIIRGTALAASGNKSEAISALTEAVSLFPDDPLSYLGRGNVYNNSGEFDKALEEYAQAIACEHSFTIGLYNRGLCYLRLKRYREALADFNRAIQLGHLESLTNRGCTLLQMGYSEEALADFSKSLEIYPRNPIALMNIGIIHEARAALDEAMTYYSRAIRCSPFYPLSYLKRAGLLAREANFAAAIQDYETGLGICSDYLPMDGSVNHTLSQPERLRLKALFLHDCGICHLQSGNLMEGRNHLRAFLEIAPPDLQDLCGPAQNTLTWIKTLL